MMLLLNSMRRIALRFNKIYRGIIMKQNQTDIFENEVLNEERLLSDETIAKIREELFIFEVRSIFDRADDLIEQDLFN